MNRTIKNLATLLITLAFTMSSLFGGILVAQAGHLELDTLNETVTAAQEAEILAQEAVTATKKSFDAAKATYTAAQNLFDKTEDITFLPETDAPITNLEQIKTLIDVVIQKTEDSASQGSIPEADKARGATGQTLGALSDLASTKTYTAADNANNAAETAYNSATSTRGLAELAWTTTTNILTKTRDKATDPAAYPDSISANDIKIAANNTIRASASARDEAEDAYKKAVIARTEAGMDVSRAQRAVEVAVASDAITAYNAELASGITAGADSYIGDNIPDIAGDLGSVTAVCLQAAATKAIAIQATRFLGLSATGAAEAAAARALAAAQSIVSVPVSDAIAATYLGRIQGTGYVHAAQSTVIEPFLDTLAYSTAQCALDQLTNSVVAWIKGGGVGSPKYAVNTEQLFADYAGQVANDLAREIRGLAICDFTPDFKLNFANAIDRSTHLRNGFTDQVSCPFGSGQFIAFGAEETSAAIQDIGWQGFEKSLGDRGNSFGVAILTNRELALRQTKGEDQQKQKLSWSNGFTDIVDVDSLDCQYPAEIADRMAGTKADEEPLSLENIAFYQKTYCPTTTPGKIIGDQFNKHLGLDADRLGLVDNMNKIIGALFETLAKKATDSAFNKLNDVFGNDEN